MTENAATATEPLWLSMEKKISERSATDFEAVKQEQTVQQLAREL